MVLMLLVVLCFTITSQNDKYAVSKAKMNGYELTFLMAAGTSVFLGAIIPFLEPRERFFTPCIQSFITIILIAACKYFEFFMSAKILEDMSVFELKAWLGITMFMSYFADVLGGEKLSLLKCLCIAAAVTGLILIAKEGKQQVNYRKIALPLVIYLLQSFGYGLVVARSEKYISSAMVLITSLVLLSLVMIPFAKPLTIAKRSPEGKKGVCLVLASKLPNAFGLMALNALAAQSLTNYSFVQPMILIVFFVMGFFTKNGDEKKNIRPLTLAGSICVVAGITAFQFV